MRGSVVSLGCQHKIYLFNKAGSALSLTADTDLVCKALCNAMQIWSHTGRLQSKGLSPVEYRIQAQIDAR
ncbi:hypothetical protein EXD76_02400 [BEV proteobacterium]|nr:hypothetical protein [Candidatus Symbiopectobacterium sp. Chty_BC]